MTPAYTLSLNIPAKVMCKNRKEINGHSAPKLCSITPAAKCPGIAATTQTADLLVLSSQRRRRDAMC